VHESIEELLSSNFGVASRSELLATVGRGALDAEIRRGHLVRLFPRVYCLPWDVDDPEIRQHGALASVGRPAALSHHTALRRWGLPCPSAPDAPIHLSVSSSRNPRPATPGLVVHHISTPFPEVSTMRGLATVSPASAIASSWPFLSGSDQRAPFLEAARLGLVTPAEVRTELSRSSRLRARRALEELANLIESGCQSELELWGYLDAFDSPGLDHAVRHRLVHVGPKTYRLDLAYEAEQVAVELDGRNHQAAAKRWEHDIARDLALATVGWQTVRLSHQRLTTDADGCRREVLQVLSACRHCHRNR
jgi:very-short-patch-repair endonuclease